MTYTCKNCKEVSESQFCSNCGQEKIDRFTFKNFLKLFTSAIEFERGLLLNLKELTLSPSSMIKAFLDGKTKSYLNPFSYFLIAFGLYSLAFILSDKIDIYGLDINSMSGIDQENQPFSFIIIITGHLAFAVANFVVFKKKWNLIESYIISLFIASQLLFIYSILLFIISGGISEWFFISPSIYAIWVLYGLYSLKLKTFFFRLLAVFIITISITASITFLILATKQIEYSKVSESSKEDYLNQRISSIESNTELFYITLKFDSTYSFIRRSSKSMTNHISSLKEELITLTGGILEDGTYTGRYRKVDRILFQNNEKRLENLNNELNNWQLNLIQCKCEPQEAYFEKNRYRNLSLIKTLEELNNLYVNVLTIERECILAKETKRITNTKSEFTD